MQYIRKSYEGNNRQKHHKENGKKEIQHSSKRLVGKFEALGSTCSKPRKKKRANVRSVIYSQKVWVKKVPHGGKYYVVTRFVLQ